MSVVIVITPLLVVRPASPRWSSSLESRAQIGNEHSRLTVALISMYHAPATGATALRTEATAMSMAMDAIMWDTDHFVTQVNPEPGPAGPRGISTDGMNCATAHNCRDFVDYDSNVRKRARHRVVFFRVSCPTELSSLWLQFTQLLSCSGCR